MAGEQAAGTVRSTLPGDNCLPRLPPSPFVSLMTAFGVSISLLVLITTSSFLPSLLPPSLLVRALYTV